MKVPALSAIREDNRKSCNRASSLPGSTARMPGAKSFGRFLPVDHTEPVVDICGPQVIMLEIIRVFPDVNVQDESPEMDDRSILVRGRHDPESSAVGDEPCIAGTKDRKSSVFKLRAKILRAAELP